MWVEAWTTRGKFFGGELLILDGELGGRLKSVCAASDSMGK